MRLKDKKKIKRFVELVKSGAPLKAYVRELGFSKSDLNYHLSLLSSYEEELKPKLQVISETVELGKFPEKKQSISEEVVKDIPKELESPSFTPKSLDKLKKRDYKRINRKKDD